MSDIEVEAMVKGYFEIIDKYSKEEFNTIMETLESIPKGFQVEYLVKQLSLERALKRVEDEIQK